MANRRYFNQRCKEAHARFQRTDDGYALLMIDIDDFKAINDRCGHDGGDQVLQSVAGALTRNIREDIELVARIGGEEFCVVCHGIHAAREALPLAERLRAAIAALRVDLGSGLAVTTSVSIGIAACRAADENWENVYRRADGALYRAKAGGRDQVCAAGD